MDTFHPVITEKVANLRRQPQKARDQTGEGGRSILVLQVKAPGSAGRAKYLETFLLVLYYFKFPALDCLTFIETRELTQISIHHGRHTLHSLQEDVGQGVEARMMGWVDHTVGDDGVLEELLRLTHLVRPAQLHRVAKAVQKPEEKKQVFPVQ